MSGPSARIYYDSDFFGVELCYTFYAEKHLDDDRLRLQKILIIQTSEIALPFRIEN